MSVVIVSYDSADEIRACLAGLDRTTYRHFDVMICENAGPEAYARLQAAAPDRLSSGQPVRLVMAEDNLGYAGGVNLGLSRTPDADAWWILNPDTIPEPDALSALVQRFERGDADIIGGALVDQAGRVQSRGGRWRPWLARAETLEPGGRRDEIVDPAAIEARLSYVSGACMLVGRRVLSLAGPMREDFFLYCEEVEWCLRAQRRGLRLGYAPGAFVLHHMGAATGSVADMRRRPRLPVYLDERNKVLLSRALYPGRAPVAIAAALILLILRFAKRRAWRQLGYALSGWCAGLLNRRGKPPWLTEHPAGAV